MSSADNGRDVAPRSRVLVVVLGALVLVLAASSIALAFVAKAHRDDRAALENARQSALTAGRQAIVNLDAISVTTIDSDLDRVLAGATGQFKDQFSKARADLKQLVLARKTVSSGTILSAGVVRADTDSATVLVAVDRLVKDTTSADGVTAHDRWRLDLEKHGGRWLVADLQPVS
ncbi:MAG: hypothetical protein WCD35_03955 [Mycobacteriales bacterium]